MSEHPNSPMARIRPSRAVSALAGMVSGSTAIAVAEVTALASPSFRNPLLDVGDRVIDAAPPWLKNFAIDIFGTADKPALLIGIAVMLGVFSALIGVAALRHRLWLGLTGIGLFAAIGATSALAGSGGAASMLPALIGSLTAALLLVWLHRWHREKQGETVEGRRAFLTRIGWVAAGSIVFGVAGRFAVSRLYAPFGGDAALPRLANPLPATPSGADFEIPGLAPFRTPNAEFYRIDTALTVPRVSTEGYKLRVFGMVEREIELSYEDILRRSQIESDITLSCVSNEVGGRLVGNARWQGFRLDDLLAEAGVDPAADQIVGRSVDGYTCGFPVAVGLDGRAAMIAIGMNGEPLPIEHGFPVRLVVPGLYGYVSATKWLTEIELTTFDAFDQYWVPRGWAAQAPIKTSSRIDTPGAFTELAPGQVMIAGVAWAQTRGIERVEVRLDEGPWREAELSEEVNLTTWRQWRIPWDVTPGRHTITCRATDQDGNTQTEERARPMPDGATGWHSVVVMGSDS